jgi:hypothetical protein
MKRPDNNRKKELRNEYENRRRRIGVFQIRNIINGKIFVGASLDLRSIFNRYRFQLSLGRHWNSALQSEWDEYGSGNFVFETLDELAPRNDPHHDYRADLAFLEGEWVDQLSPYEARGYNQRKRCRDDKLRRMIAGRQKEAPWYSYPNREFDANREQEKDVSQFCCAIDELEVLHQTESMRTNQHTSQEEADYWHQLQSKTDVSNNRSGNNQR